MHTISRLFVAIFIAVMAVGCASSEAIRQRRAVRMDKSVVMNGNETVEQSIARLEALGDTGDAHEVEVRRRALEILYKQRNLRDEALIARGDSPVEREARKQVNRESRNDSRHDERARKAVNSINLQSCDLDSVWVNPSIGNDWGLRRSVENNMVGVIVTNQSTYPMDVLSTYHGDMVKRVCPGGTFTLTFASRYMGPDTMTFVLKAFIYTPSGTRTAELPISIQSNNQAGLYHSYNRVDTVTWEPFRR